jgi:tetratricopeptide (TPR) repeat protein
VQSAENQQQNSPNSCTHVRLPCPCTCLSIRARFAKSAIQKWRFYDCYHRNKAFTYKGKSVDVKQIDRELGLRYVLEGSVRRTGEQVRVNVQLVDAKSGAHLWADRFDTDRQNVAERDANRAAAHMAMGVLRRVQNRLPEAQIEFETTTALDRDETLTYTNLGQVFLCQGQPDAAIGPIATAIRLSPHNPFLAVSYRALGASYLLLGQVDKAAALIRKARAANRRKYVTAPATPTDPAAMKCPPTRASRWKPDEISFG